MILLHIIFSAFLCATVIVPANVNIRVKLIVNVWRSVWIGTTLVAQR